jgi:general secretion pathway protein J
MVGKTCSKYSDQERGFTLLELLIAISLLSIVAIMSWQGLDILLRSRERIQNHIDLNRAQRHLTEQFRQDCQNIAPSQRLNFPTYLFKSDQLVLVLARPHERHATVWQVVRFNHRNHFAYRELWPETSNPQQLLTDAKQAHAGEAPPEQDRTLELPNITHIEFKGWIENVGWTVPVESTSNKTLGTLRAIEWSLYEAHSSSPIRILCLL